MYVAHKYDYQGVKKSLLSIAAFVEVLDLEAKTVKDMLSSDWKDYEDATQNATALNAGSNCIVTRNKKDFKDSSLSVYTVDELFAKF